MIKWTRLSGINYIYLNDVCLQCFVIIIIILQEQQKSKKTVRTDKKKSAGVNEVFASDIGDDDL